jgi:hypothetical protein
MPKTKTPAYYRFPLNPKLCVMPTEKEDESQYEAFQSVIAAIMSANIGQGADTPYTVLCEKSGIQLVEGKIPPTKGKIPPTKGKIPPTKGKRQKNAIYYEGKAVTHYRVVLDDGSVADPYDLYQAQGTQGFCQMFAYFISTGQTARFHQVNQRVKINTAEFVKLANNTYECGRQTVAAIKSDPEVYALFKKDFNRLVKSDYGIAPKTTCEKFLLDFLSLTVNDVFFYIYDQPLRGWTLHSAKAEVWDFISTDPGWPGTGQWVLKSD